MKFNFIYMVIVIAFLAVVTSCAKDQPVAPEKAITNEGIEVLIDTRAIAPETGVVVGKIVPESKYLLILHNKRSSIDLFSIDARSGYFIFKNIPVGTYTLAIHLANGEPKEIENVIVLNRKITNLGIIGL